MGTKIKTKKTVSKKFPLSDVVSMSDFKKEDILFVLKRAAEMEKMPREKKSNLCKNKIVASLFFEPSTRTRLSFETSAKAVGAKVIGFDSAISSSTKKGETLTDSILTVANYVDLIIMRHSVNGAARRAAEVSKVPVLNGGDGSNQHPSQTLLDLYTIKKNFGKLEGLTVGFLGDLKYGRTVRCLAQALSLFNTKKMYFISHESLRLQEQYIDDLSKSTTIIETEDLDSCAKELDLLYVTRTQKERFPDQAEYEKVKSMYQIDRHFLDKAKKGIKIMHPLPRVDEISTDLDDYEGSIYFEQAGNGIPVREALIDIALKQKKGKK